MIKTVFIDCIDDVMQLISEQEYNSNIQRIRSSYFYRGVPDVKYRMVTSLQRNCKNLQKDLEKPILRNFTKYASIEDPSLCDSVWKQMIVGQHHGLPTRLLDWTYSPLVALHFANTENNLDKFGKRDCVVWRMDMRESNKNLPQKYRDALDAEHAFVFSVDSLSRVADSIEQYDLDMGMDSIACIEPPSIDQRIISQYSFFSVIPSGITDIEDYYERHESGLVKYIIKKEIRWDVRDLLDQMNINERIIYPGLDGLSKLLARHYYVNDEVSERTGK
ncbi:MAG: FRG domain-containing protein [Clostridia bacterium]|nr:FRG domain-containing protein [Clostridia bacterium]